MHIKQGFSQKHYIIEEKISSSALKKCAFVLIILQDVSNHIFRMEIKNAKKHYHMSRGVFLWHPPRGDQNWLNLSKLWVKLLINTITKMLRSQRVWRVATIAKETNSKCRNGSLSREIQQYSDRISKNKRLCSTLYGQLIIVHVNDLHVTEILLVFLHIAYLRHRSHC